MKRTWMTILAMAAIASMGAGGCEDDDGRLAEYAQKSVEQQASQNEQIARQNLEVTQQNRQVAEAARNLVEADAKARQEMVIAQKTLHQGLQDERSNLDRQREAIEQERKDLAAERHWEPVIAEVMGGVSVLFACLAPLAICWYVLRNLHQVRDDDSALNELLIGELASENPRLLLSNAETLPAIEREPLRVDPDPTDGLAIDPPSGS